MSDSSMSFCSQFALSNINYYSIVILNSTAAPSFTACIFFAIFLSLCHKTTATHPWQPWIISQPLHNQCISQKIKNEGKVRGIYKSFARPQFSSLSHWPLSMWWEESIILGHRGSVTPRLPHFYLPQVFTGTHLLTIMKGRMYRWVDCLGWDLNKTSYKWKFDMNIHITREMISGRYTKVVDAGFHILSLPLQLTIFKYWGVTNHQNAIHQLEKWYEPGPTIKIHLCQQGLGWPSAPWQENVCVQALHSNRWPPRTCLLLWLTRMLSPSVLRSWVRLVPNTSW